jgi:hypothetical protein
MNIQPKALATRSSSRATNVNAKALLKSLRDYSAKMKNKNCGICGIINMKSITNHTNIGKL